MTKTLFAKFGDAWSITDMIEALEDAVEFDNILEGLDGDDAPELVLKLETFEEE